MCKSSVFSIFQSFYTVVIIMFSSALKWVWPTPKEKKDDIEDFVMIPKETEDIVASLKDYCDRIEGTRNVKEKAAIADDLLSFLIENREWVNSHDDFKQPVFEEMSRLAQTDPARFQERFERLFGTSGDQI